MFSSRKKVKEQIKRIWKVNSPIGRVQIDELPDYFRFSFHGEECQSCLFVESEGDLLRVTFNPCGGIDVDTDLACVIWMLNSPRVRTICNQKFGNCENLDFSAAVYGTTVLKGENPRSCVVLPNDAVDEAVERFNNVWFKQAPISGYTGEICTKIS